VEATKEEIYHLKTFKCKK